MSSNDSAHEMDVDVNDNNMDEQRRGRLSRRGFFGLSALAGTVAAAAMLGESDVAAAQRVQGSSVRAPAMQDDPSIVELQALMAARKLDSVMLVNRYLDRIRVLDKSGPALNAIIELNPDAPAVARALDEERKSKGPRGPLHGIPVLLKDNIDTGDRMQTTAGSWALYGTPAPRDSTVAARLRAAGAVILGKTNLTEFANTRSLWFTSGWSGRGGQTRNPYVLDRNPLGSSAGSAVAVSSNLTTVSLGTETDGSVVLPASVNGVVRIKPTVGLTSRAGVVPISYHQDSVGLHARSVADAAALLGTLVGVDPRDPITLESAGKFHTDYTKFLNPDGLRGARIGVMRKYYFGSFDTVDALAETAIQAMKNAGATIVDPADIPTIDQITLGPQEGNVQLYEFKVGLNAYLATRTGIPAHMLADVITFNQTHPEELLNIFDQVYLELSQNDVVSAQVYQDSLAQCYALARQQGIDALMSQYNLDTLVAPVFGPAYTTDWVYGDHFQRLGGFISTPASQAGYPIISVPAGFVFGLPIGMGFLGRAYSEPTLIKLASGFEAVTKARQPPQFIPALETSSTGNRRELHAQDFKTIYEDMIKRHSIPHAG